MFERGRNHSNAEKSRRAVVVTLQNGDILKGTLGTWAGTKIIETLNGQDEFLDFQSHEGEAVLLAKRAVLMVKTIETEKPQQLKDKLRDVALLDPHAILGIARGADAEAIKHAYHSLVRLYHPDRFATLDLPREMNEYASAMLTRINLAYEQLSAGR